MTRPLVVLLLALPFSVTTAAEAQYLGSESTSVRSRIAEAEAEKARAETEVEQLGVSRDAARERLKQRTRALYRLSRSGMLPLAGGLDALLRHRSRLDRLRRLVNDDLASIEDLGAREQALRARLERLNTALTQLQSGLRSVEAEEERQRREAFDATFRARTPSFGSQVSMNGPMGYGSMQVHGAPMGEGFAGLRGHLGLPLHGTVSTREGRREDGVGLEFLAPMGTPVRAVADGRVAFADRYASYGLLVILDHGEGYFTVYAGLGEARLELGQSVMRGTTVGTVGADGQVRGAYFEVRRGSRALDAPSWLGL